MPNISVVQKILLSIIGLGVAGTVLGVGTLASFTAQTGNPNNTFATGTLVMKQASGGLSGGSCYSTNDTTSTGRPATTTVSCGSFVSISNLKPGDIDTSSAITITNQGSLSSIVTLAMSCTDGNASTTYNGTGNLCSQLELYVQAKNTSTGAVIQCVYGNVASTNTCDLNGSGYTPGSYGATAKSLNSSAGSPWAPAASVQYVFGVKLPTASGNTFQGRQATIGLTWTATQT